MIQDRHLDKVLQTVQLHSEAELPEEIVKAADWCHLYHLSAARTNLIEWIPVGPDEDVLEFGAECGALTGILAGRAAAVTAVELDPVKTEVNRTRHRERSNITYLTGGLYHCLSEEPEERYDKIFLVGSLPLAEQYVENGGEPAYRILLTELKKRLKPDGRLILALPNKFGLKYFAGCREDYFGAPFTGLEGYYYHKGMKTFGRRELETLLTECGFPEFRFYYPYPDYRFMGSLYSDDRLPQAGELNTNLVNFDQDRYVFFDETKVYDSLIGEGLFPELANSFLVITGQEPVSELVYTKYSIERAEAFWLRTDIGKRGTDGERYAAKTALRETAAEHVRQIASAYEALKTCYAGSGLEPCRCRDKGTHVEFEFLRGETLQQRLERLSVENRTDEITALLDSYRARVSGHAKDTFRMTDGFREVFGEATLPEELRAAAVSDIDLIFSNILLPDGDGPWKFIDYEWTFSFPVPLHFLLYRAYYFASHQIQQTPALNLSDLLRREGITEEESHQYERMELHFQKYVTGDTYPERDLLGPIGNRIIPITDMETAYLEKKDSHGKKKRFPDLRRYRQRV